MANAFQDMLERFGLVDNILAVNADNATSNDTQTTKLDELDNSFDKENRVRCFNHTIQLSAKSLLKPFNTALGKATDDDDAAMYEDDNNPPILDDDDGDDGEEEEEEEEDVGEVEDDGVDELQELNEEDRGRMLEETAAVRGTVTKVRFAKQKMFAFLILIVNYLQVRQLSFAIIHSTTIVLPAWRRACRDLDLKERLIPRDVVTRWNSTYDMMRFVLAYRPAIDKITADKALKLRKYELDNDDWVVIEDLVSVLEVRYSQLILLII